MENLCKKRSKFNPHREGEHPRDTQGKTLSAWFGSIWGPVPPNVWIYHQRILNGCREVDLADGSVGNDGNTGLRKELRL